MATGPTWAQVVCKKKPTTFHPTECAVNLEQFAAPLHLPPVSSRHSAFVPLPSTYKQAWAGDIVSALPLSALGLYPGLTYSYSKFVLLRRMRSKTSLLTRSSVSILQHTLSLLLAHRPRLF